VCSWAWAFKVRSFAPATVGGETTSLGTAKAEKSTLEEEEAVASGWGDDGMGML